MALAELFPDEVEDVSCGRFLTFIVPAANGCNLRCGFCIIRQRGEADTAILSPSDFERFVHEAAEREPILAQSIQGREPLLPEAWPYTELVFGAGRRMNIPTSLVTNGIFLKRKAERLRSLCPNRIAVSLDAASPDAHDRLRRVEGAWAETVKNIEYAVKALSPKTNLAVASVLVPTQRHWLDGMPKLLGGLGVSRWIINPLLRIGRRKAGGLVGKRREIFADLLVLQKAAGDAGIRMTVSDEFDCLKYTAACLEMPTLNALEVRRLPPNAELFRLTPDGRCSIGAGFLQDMPVRGPRWHPANESAGDFLQRVRGSGPSINSSRTKIESWQISKRHREVRANFNGVV